MSGARCEYATELAAKGERIGQLESQLAQCQKSLRHQRALAVVRSSTPTSKPHNYDDNSNIYNSPSDDEGNAALLKVNSSNILVLDSNPEATCSSVTGVDKNFPISNRDQYCLSAADSLTHDQIRLNEMSKKNDLNLFPRPTLVDESNQSVSNSCIQICETQLVQTVDSSNALIHDQQQNDKTALNLAPTSTIADPDAEPYEGTFLDDTHDDDIGYLIKDWNQTNSNIAEKYQAINKLLLPSHSNDEETKTISNKNYATNIIVGNIYDKEYGLSDQDTHSTSNENITANVDTRFLNDLQKKNEKQQNIQPEITGCSGSDEPNVLGNFDFTILSSKISANTNLSMFSANKGKRAWQFTGREYDEDDDFGRKFQRTRSVDCRLFAYDPLDSGTPHGVTCDDSSFCGKTFSSHALSTDERITSGNNESTVSSFGSKIIWIPHNRTQPAVQGDSNANTSVNYEEVFDKAVDSSFPRLFSKPTTKNFN